MSNILRTYKLLLPVSIFLLAACGQKGPLFLPGDPSEIRTEVPEQDAEVEDAADVLTEDEEDELPE